MDDKALVQEALRLGDLRVIAATHAFGRRIDEPGIRPVDHADIPGSQENDLQEAGRDGQPADCVRLYHNDDVRRPLPRSARLRLERHEIGVILKALRQIDGQSRNSGKVVTTPADQPRRPGHLDRRLDRGFRPDPSRPGRS